MGKRDFERYIAECIRHLPHVKTDLAVLQLDSEGVLTSIEVVSHEVHQHQHIEDTLLFPMAEIENKKHSSSTDDEALPRQKRSPLE
ncbi:MAG TPA: hypothetical protein V6D26_17495 [Stenomitos sp.]